MTAGENPDYPQTSQGCYRLGGTKASLSIPDLTVWEQNGQPNWWQPISATREAREHSVPLVNQINHFIDIINQIAQPLVSGHEGTKSLQVIEAIQSAAESGETVQIKK